MSRLLSRSLISAVAAASLALPSAASAVDPTTTNYVAIDQAVTVLPGKTCPASLPAWINGRRAGVLSGGPDRWGNGCEVGGTLATNLKPGTWVLVSATSPSIFPLLTFATVHAKLAIS